MSKLLSEIRKLSFEDLVEQSRDLAIDNASTLTAAELVFQLVCSRNRNQHILGDGLLEILPDGFGFLRSPVSHFATGADDIYVSPSQIRRFNLRSGDWVSGEVRTPKSNERYLALLRINQVNGLSPEETKKRLTFDSQTVKVPSEPVVFSNEQMASLQDLSLKNGQSHMIVLEEFQHPSSFVLPWSQALDAEQNETLLLLLNYPLPDIEVANRALPKLQSKGHILYSLRGDGAQRHGQILELALHRAKRLVEQGKQVHIVLSSLNDIALSERDQVEQAGRQGSASLGVESVLRFLSSSRAMAKAGSLSLWTCIHRDRSAYEDDVFMRALYEVNACMVADINSPCLIDIDQSKVHFGH